MRVGVYRSVVVKKDRTHSFEQLLQGFRDDIAMLDDGCMLFTFIRMKSKARHYTIHEEYVNEEAHQAHSKTKHHALWWSAILAQIYRMKVEFFEVAEEIEPAGR